MKKIISLLLCFCLTLGCPQVTQASTGLTVWDEFAKSMEQNSKLPSSFGEAVDWAEDRFTDVKGAISGVINSTDRKGYRYNDRPQEEPVINAVTNGLWGNELSFVKGACVDDGKIKSSSLTVKAGKTYEITIHYINDCYMQIFAEDVELYIDMPGTVKKGRPVNITAAISSSNTNPKLVYDSIKIKTKDKKPLKLKYIKNSMTIHNNWNTDGQKLNATNAFNINKRVKLGCGALDGTLMAGEDNAGTVTFKFKATR